MVVVMGIKIPGTHFQYWEKITLSNRITDNQMKTERTETETNLK
jgi:hypothetical protein